MTKMTGSDCAVMCNLINTHTHTEVFVASIIPPMGGSMRVAYNDQDDRAGLGGYVQFNKYTHLSRLIRGFRNKYH